VRWQQQSRACHFYLLVVYVASIPFAYLCFSVENRFSFQWLLFTVISVFVATINVRLPKLSVVISMVDVFIIFVLMQFGPGPALVTYGIDIIVAGTADLLRRYGRNLKGKIFLDRWLFNIACCALSTWTMYALYSTVGSLSLTYPSNVIAALFSVAIGWFLVNTGTLSLALSFWMNRGFWSVWREGISLYLLNFLGSAAAAGVISIFYQRAGFFLKFILLVPIAVIAYQLYRFYIEKYEQAQSHISQLNRLYLQTVEALASAVDAKDRYTHGHIRRVQAYAAELASHLGVKDEKELLSIRAGALLHDIGKIAIPEYILNKPTALTETEYEKMKIHPVVGANMLNTIEFPYPLIPMVKWHHERWDGNGYPDGLKGAEIPLNARILALVDCYDALTTNRPYRSPMEREQVIQFFLREAGRSYDPNIVQVFIDHLEAIEAVGKAVDSGTTDVWGLKETPSATKANVRPLEKVQPIVTYGKALNAGPDIQRELYSVFEFARADFQCVTSTEIFAFMGRRLEALIRFDAAAFFAADLRQGVVTAVHTVGGSNEDLSGLTLPLEQKLTGWVAANNQALCNLPPFPDFLNCAEPRPSFQMSAIAPMNRHSHVFGAISLYRKDSTKFDDEEFRRLEIVASQTAIMLAKSNKEIDGSQLLVDNLTSLPNGFQLYLMFDQVAMDAARYEYPLALLSINLDDIKDIRHRWGHLSGDEAIRAAAQYLKNELRETDFLVRYAGEEFIAINPRMSREQAENLKSRLQNELDHFKFAVRGQTEIPLEVSIGIAIFPEDGADLEALLLTAELRLHEDRELRAAVRRGVRSLQLSN
jgi:diguanylate cyclase (GGDEF)-like protein/putative nucleotidyltransferase with HDIG domain